MLFSEQSDGEEEWEEARSYSRRRRRRQRPTQIKNPAPAVKPVNHSFFVLDHKQIRRSLLIRLILHADYFTEIVHGKRYAEGLLILSSPPMHV